MEAQPETFKMSIIRMLILIVVTFYLAACDGGSSDNNSDGGGGSGGTTTTDIGTTGGTATSDDGKVTLSIPPAALSATRSITIAPASRSPSSNIGTAYKFGPDGLTFDQPVTISIKYDESDLPAGFSETGLVLSRLFNDFSWYEMIGARVDEINNTVSFDTYSFSTYGLKIGGFSASLDGSSSGSAATGTALFEIDIEKNLLSYNISYLGLEGLETTSHIYGLSNTSLHDLPKGSTKVGVWSYNESNESDILAGKMTVNILSDTYAGGEISGQIEPLGPTGMQSDVTVQIVLWDDLAGSSPDFATPSSVDKVLIRISSYGMAQQEMQADILANPVEEAFQIAKGLARYFEVLAYDNADQLIYKGVAYADIINSNEVIKVKMIDTVIIGDNTPPTFAGITSAQKVSGDSISLSWSSGTDDNTEKAGITYLIYMATSSGGQDFSAPSYVTKSGDTSYSMSGLAAGTTYYFVVRAMDQSGNIDANSIEVSADTYSAGTGLYVNVNVGDDTDPNCGSAVKPCKTITHALVKSPGNEPIYVARGVYDSNSGENFPLQLKTGTSLEGELLTRCVSISKAVASGWFCSAKLLPMSTIRSSTQESVILGADNVFIGALNISVEPALYSSLPMIDNDGKPAEIRYVALVGEDIMSTAIKLTGGHSSVKYSLISGFEISGILAYGDHLSISSNTLNENMVGMGVESDYSIISRNYVDHNTHAMSVSSISGDSSSIVFGNTVSRSYRGLKVYSGIEVVGNRLYENEDFGIRIFNDDVLSDPVILRNNRIYQNGTGISVRYRANAIIHGNTLICNDVWDLSTDTVRQIDARYNSWDHSPPTIDPGSFLDYFDCDRSGVVDICYSRDYSGTPEPSYSPDNGTSSCSGVSLVPY